MSRVAFMFLIKKYFQNFYGLSKIAWLGIILIFLDAIAGGMCFFFALYFVNYLHFSVPISGLLLSIYGLGTVTGGMLGGRLTNIISPKILSSTNLVIQGFLFFILIWISSVPILIIILFMMGVSAYVFKTSVNYWILSHSSNSKHRLKILNLARVGSNLGLCISGIIIGMFADKHFHSIFLFSSMLFLSSFLFLIINQFDLNIFSYSANQNEYNQTFKYDNKIIINVLIFAFLVGLMIGQLGTTYPLFIQNIFKELGLKAVSILFMLDTILIVIFQAPLVNSLEKYNKVYIIGIGGFSMGLGMLLLNYSFNFLIAIISCVFWTTGEMLFIPVAQLICSEQSLNQKSGLGLGYYYSLYAAGTISGPFLGSIVCDYFGWRALWFTCFMIGLCCFFSCNYFARTLKAEVINPI